MAQINLRVDDDIKKNAEIICEEIGISISAAINIYLKKIVRERRIPFELSADPFYSDSNMSALNESIEQLKKGQIVIKTLEELEEMTDGK